MLTFYLGQAKSGKKDLVFRKLQAEAKNGSEVLFIVPEQYSFEAERELLNRIEPKLTANISLLNFTSLANEIKRIYGGNCAKIIDNSTRVMLMHKAVKSLGNELKLFGLENISFGSVSKICNAIVELKQENVTPKKLSSAASSLNGSPLALKLNDLSLIMSAYDSVLGDTFIDPVDELTFAYNKIKDNGYFKNKSVFIYGFTGFSGKQYKILKQLISDSDSVHISLCTNGETENEFSLFSNVNDTFNKINSLANDLRKDIRIEKISENNYYKGNLNALQTQLVSKKTNVSVCNAIHAVSADSKYDELEFVATKIHRLVREQGLRFRDFAVITRSLSNYSNAANVIFKKLNVPIFVDEKISLCELPICTLILSALRGSRSFKTKEIYKFLKSGLTDVSDDEINEIDNYVFLWSIDKEEWLKDFVKNPFGLQERNADEIHEKLTTYNNLRKKIVYPLLDLSKLKSATGAEFCRAIYKLLDNCNVSEHLSNYAKELTNSESNLAQYLATGWTTVNNIFDTIYTCYGDDVLTFKEFYDIVNLCFTNATLSGIPQGLDEVALINADRIVSLDVKYAFVLGMNYGEFPAEYKPSGIFNNAEKGFLQGLEINIGEDYISCCVEEEYLLYKALTTPSESLYILAHSSDYTNTCDYSTAYKEIVTAFNLEKECAPDRNDCYSSIETPLQAVSVLAKNRNINALKALVRVDGVDTSVRELVDNIVSFDSDAVPEINKNIANMIYGTSLYISPSKLEQFYKCPYAYFYKYGLNISTREKIDFKIMQRGTIAHYVLEKALCSDFDSVVNMDTAQLKGLIDNLIEEYIRLTIGENASLDGEGKYLLKRIAKMLYDLVPYVINELKVSSFKPIAFELKIGDSGAVPPLVIKEKDFTAKIGGIVDRVDAAEINGMPFIRIVDYKTGTKTFKLPDVLYGLNLQMLIYLCAICDDGKLGKLPAAIIYQPLNHVMYSGVDKISNNAAKAKGVVLENLDVISAMDPLGAFMPTKIKADGSLSKSSPCLTNEEFQEIFKYVKQKFTLMCRKLLDGDIAPAPCNLDSQHKTCMWCDYKSICQKNNDDIATTVESMCKEDVINIIKESVSNGN